MRVHVDTDFGGDPDDACALALLLGWPGVEIAGVTTNLDEGGTRAGCVAYVLGLAGRDEIPVVAGAEESDTTHERFASTWDDARFFPERIHPAPATRGAAVDLLRASLSRGSTIVAIGALTNLARLERVHRGALRNARVVAMAGWIDAPADDLPQWGAASDFNAQCDTRAVEIVAAAGADLTLVNLPAAMHAQLRARDLPRLRAASAVGALLARQSEVYGHDREMAELGRAHAGLADDLVNFHWDPVTAVAAVGWDGITTTERRLATVVERDVVRFIDDPAGARVSVVTAVDGARFAEQFLRAVESTE